MDIVEPYRHRGFGSYLVQELKRAAYELGCVPAAPPTSLPERLPARDS